MNTVSLSVFQPRLLATCPFTPTPCPHAHPTVYSSALEWLPQGSEMPDETGCRFTASQAGRFPADALPAPVHPDILLARLRPGQVRMCVCVWGGGMRRYPVLSMWRSSGLDAQWGTATAVVPLLHDSIVAWRMQ